MIATTTHCHGESINVHYSYDGDRLKSVTSTLITPYNGQTEYDIAISFYGEKNPRLSIFLKESDLQILQDSIYRIKKQIEEKKCLNKF